MSTHENGQPFAPSVEQDARPADRGDEPIPAVCFLDDLARILHISRRTIEKLRRHGAFPIRELPSLDKRPRWSGVAVRQFRDGGQRGSNQPIAMLHARKRRGAA